MSRRRSSAGTCRLATPGKPCCFCGLSEDNELEYGKIYELGTIVTHYYCLLLSSLMQQRGRDDQGILGFLAADIEKELRRGKRLACYHCKKNGATLGCCNTKCKRIFHLPCGLKNGSLHQFYSEFRSYCINHRPKQLIDGRVLEEVQKAENTVCYICYDNVNYRDILAMLWAPCCKKNAFFHRKCVQQLANSSGYFFKCPLCNNKKEFQEAMLEHGIYIPSQDASWELVPNAFHELLYRHNQCDAELCLCPKGRSHSSSNAKWELVLCRMCGSQGIHRHCGHLKWANSSWECLECQSILDKSTNVNRQVRSPGVTEGNAESGGPISGDLDSDSDLSVGQDSNQQAENNSQNPDSEDIPTVKVRPGPLSYKMKEVMKVAQSQPATIDSSSCLEGTNTSTSLTEIESGDKKIVDDPNTVILLDSDEEPEDIEIISEKLNPKVLTTNDGKKIEILDKRGIEEITESAKQKAEALRTAVYSMQQKDSKPTITSIQTMKAPLDPKQVNQMVNARNFIHQDLKPIIATGNTAVRATNPQNPNPGVDNNRPGPRIISQQISAPRNPTPHNFNQRFMNAQVLNAQVSSQNNSPNFHPRIASPQSFSQRSAAPQNFHPRTGTSQSFSPRSAAPQNIHPGAASAHSFDFRHAVPQNYHFGTTTQQNFNPRSATSQMPIPRNAPPLPQNSQNYSFVKHYPNSPSHPQSPMKQVSTPTKNCPNPGNNLPPGVQNPEMMSQGRALSTNVPPSYAPIKMMPEEESMGIKITSVCSLPADYFENMGNENHDLKSAGISSFSSSLKKEPSDDSNLKRKAEIPGPSQYFEKQGLDIKRTRVLDQRIIAGGVKPKVEAEFKSEGNEGKEGLNSGAFDEKKKEREDQFPMLRKNLVHEAMLKANITSHDMVSTEINVRNNQPSTSSLHTTVNNYVAMPSSNMTIYMGGDSPEVLNIAGKKIGSCQREASTSPVTISNRHGVSPIESSNQVGVQADDQITSNADSRIGIDSLEDSKFSDLCCSNSEGCNELSESSSSCDSAGLIPDNVSLSDVKFRVCGSDIVQVILYDKYRIDIKMDNTGSRSPRDSDSSPLPCPSFPYAFNDPQNPGEEIPRKRVRDFEFEENTLQEFPATSKSPKISPDSTTTGVTTREKAAKAAKENLNSIKPIIESNESKKPSMTPFTNDLRILRLKKNSMKSKAAIEGETCLNCKVSIDLKKIWDLVEAKPHLFSKYDESLCKYKNQELKLTDVCKIKNKWLLVESQSQDSFYGVSTRSRLLYRSKSMEDLSAVDGSGPQNKEESKKQGPRPILRRGLKRKCRFSMPCR